MNTRKELNLDVKKSTLKTIRKYILVTLCCFVIAIIYPFINIYWGTYSVYIMQNPNANQYSLYSAELANVRLEPYIENDSRILYSRFYGQESEYSDIVWLADIKRTEIAAYNIEKESERAEEMLKEYIGIFSSIKMVFGIEHYAKIFYWIFFPLLITTIVLMNFKFNFKIKNE
ncbi:hypothetical protein [Dysgonomonas reticulitermitis]